MSDRNKPNGGNLVRAGRGDLLAVPASNPLVSRGMGDLAKIQKLPGEFHVSSPADYKNKLRRLKLKTLRLLNLLLLVREARHATHPIRPPLPNGSHDVLAALGNKEAMLRFGLPKLDKDSWANLENKELWDCFGRDNDLLAFALHMRGIAWRDNEKYEKAILDFEKAIKLNSKDPFVHRTLARLFASCPEEKFRNGKRAILTATKACDLTGWEIAGPLRTLAAVYAEAGQFHEAEHIESKALEVLARQGPVGQEWRQRLELYKQKKPYREHA